MIVLDTNFLIYCAKNKIDFQEQISNLSGDNIITLKQVILELEKIASNKKAKISERKAAKIALQMLEFRKISLAETKPLIEDADTAILDLVLEYDNIVIATMDKELRKKIKEANPEARFLTIRKGKKIEWL